MHLNKKASKCPKLQFLSAVEASSKREWLMLKYLQDGEKNPVLISTDAFPFHNNSRVDAFCI